MDALTWVFCPGHTEDHGNELADRLAGNATDEYSLTRDSEDIAWLVLQSLREAEEREWEKYMYINTGRIKCKKGIWSIL